MIWPRIVRKNTKLPRYRKYRFDARAPLIQFGQSYFVTCEVPWTIKELREGKTRGRARAWTVHVKGKDIKKWQKKKCFNYAFDQAYSQLDAVRWIWNH